MTLACFDLHTTLNKPTERELSLSNKATLSQSEPIQMLFIKLQHVLALLLLFESKTNSLFTAVFNAVVLNEHGYES